MKKPIGSQFSFSNLDGARASISSEDRLSISFERQEAVEDGEEEEMKEEKEEVEEEEKNEKVVQLWSPEKLRRDYITSDPSVTCGPSGKVTGSEGHVFNNININDPTSTLGPSRDPTDPSASGVTAEPIDPNRCLRPLQRARERRAARLKEESHADAEFDPDPHVPRVKLGDACWVCNVVGADVDWYQHDWHEGIAICMPCIDNTEKGRSLLQFCKIEFEERQNSQ